ncbi:uncharacterized protein TRAVEDRAFT_39008 [Trametes versicolor FP-101664 SS1]|uniref:uncharacterized protein n=1 Tax=Trametes versicolor (strain FP-101664) TaxID=717944 RepID=UPI0004623851|nr:uncharacterized protein TRAVEDRAFT_39008 [Trametes versicolor FP-101664 SS1]EIW55872.1 hypothetical protein TRAVEDRAFT_39008 [Trametes versicolor FP-101664 SS1]
MHAPKTIMSMTTSALFVLQDIPSPPRRDYHVASAIRRAYRAVVTFSSIRGTYDSLRRTASDIATATAPRHDSLHEGGNTAGTTWTDGVGPR